MDTCVFHNALHDGEHANENSCMWYVQYHKLKYIISEFTYVFTMCASLVPWLQFQVEIACILEWGQT